MQETTMQAPIAAEALLHAANIVVHVTCASAALVLGTVQLVRRKGGADHLRRGSRFVRTAWLAVATAAIGLGAFRFRATLAVTTLLVAYWLYSGMRALQIRDTGPRPQDGIASLCGLAAAAAFIVSLQVVRFPWAPHVVYSTLGTLVAVSTYDLARFAFPRRWFRSSWLPEHIVKMIGAYGALLSAFGGTVLSAWQPYSQIVPSVVGTGLMLAFLWRSRAPGQRGSGGREAGAPGPLGLPTSRA